MLPQCRLKSTKAQFWVLNPYGSTTSSVSKHLSVLVFIRDVKVATRNQLICTCKPTHERWPPGLRVRAGKERNGLLQRLCSACAGRPSYSFSWSARLHASHLWCCLWHRHKFIKHSLYNFHCITVYCLLFSWWRKLLRSPDINLFREVWLWGVPE